MVTPLQSDILEMDGRGRRVLLYRFAPTSSSSSSAASVGLFKSLVPSQSIRPQQSIRPPQSTGPLTFYQIFSTNKFPPNIFHQIFFTNNFPTNIFHPFSTKKFLSKTVHRKILLKTVPKFKIIFAQFTWSSLSSNFKT